MGCKRRVSRSPSPPRAAEPVPAVWGPAATLGEERGSVLLIALVMVFTMTLLGLALFDLGAFESRLVLVDQADARAFEAAHAGLARGRAELRRIFSPGPVPPNVNWATNALQCGPGGLGCPLGTFTDLYLFGPNSSVPDNGSFALRVRPMTSGEYPAEPCYEWAVGPGTVPP